MDYICAGDQESLNKILLHNREDLEGMVYISRCMSGLLDAAEGRFDIAGVSDSGDLSDDLLSASESVLSIQIVTENPFLSSVSIAYEPTDTKKGIPFSFRAEGRQAVFSLRSFSGTLKYFFEDYKDYFYLPEEGRAVHRSVGQFVDPAYREKAKKETAFEPVEAVFYPQCGPVIRPEFRKSADDRTGYFRPEDVKDTEALKDLIKTAFGAAING